MIFCCALLCVPVVSEAQATSDLKKLASNHILTKAVNGEKQQVIVEFESGTLQESIAKRRMQLQETANQMASQSSVDSPPPAGDDELVLQDKALVKELQRGLGKFKSEVFGATNTGSARIVRDFENIPFALVEIRSINDLRHLQAHGNVKSIHEDAEVKIAADWSRGIFSDFAQINAPTTNTRGPKTGDGTRVAVLDQPAFLAGLPGFNNGDGCHPYSGMNFTNDNLAGGYNSNSGCRVWDAYNFVNQAEQYCANPYGNPVGQICPHDHGTAVMDVILRTAPSTYISALQVFDRNGLGKSTYITAALNWIIGNQGTKPKIVAVNLSLKLDDTKYSAFCNDEPVSKTLRSLLGYGIVPVVATGNSGWKDGINAPACAQGILAVGAVADSATLATSYPSANCNDPSLSKDQVGCFSNSHPKIPIVLAPGIEIGNAKLADELKHTGTSMAAPHVAGQVAILRGTDIFPFMSAYDIIDLVKFNGAPISDRLAPGNVATRVDIQKSINPPRLSSMSISPTSASLTIGQTVNLVVIRATDTSGAAMPIPKVTIWSSDNPSIAAVDPSGIVTAKGAGIAMISATSSGVQSSATVRVSLRNGGGPDCSKDPRLCR